MRELHVPQSLASIDWNDYEPPLLTPDGERLVHNEIFFVDRLLVEADRVIASESSCSVLIPVDGSVSCGGSTFGPGQLFLVLAADALALPIAPAGGERGHSAVREQADGGAARRHADRRAGARWWERGDVARQRCRHLVAGEVLERQRDRVVAGGREGERGGSHGRGLCIERPVQRS